tara:strand:- start:15750 stop:16133 length:384 start_codon:yes stop_codon:yes gene_type:complete
MTELNQNILNLILDESVCCNSKLEITDCLIYYNNFFIQILEGDKKSVLSTYDRILKDKSHHKIELLWENNSEKRYFENWNMGFFSPENESEIIFVNNYKLLSRFADKSIGASLRFWASVEKILDSKK